MRCPQCGNDNFRKSGTSGRGNVRYQRYKCNVCNRLFTENTCLEKLRSKNSKSILKPSKDEILICPKCNSNNIRSAGTRGNKQRLRCKDCNTSFTYGVEYKPATKYEPLQGKKCPRCNSTYIHRDGFHNGTQRYICKSCKKEFTENPKEVVEIKFKCPYCNGRLIRSGFGKLGQQEYKCTQCGKSCSSKTNEQPEKLVTFEENNTTIHCPNCESIHVKLAGTLDKGQRYICKDCGRAFLYGSQSRIKSIRQVNGIINDYMKLKSTKDICSRWDASEKTVRRIIKKYKENEVLTEKQKQMIYNYGVILGTDAKYVAPYIPCTLDAYYKEVSKYNVQTVKCGSITEKEKAFDRLELDRFISG